MLLFRSPVFNASEIAMFILSIGPPYQITDIFIKFEQL